MYYDYALHNEAKAEYEALKIKLEPDQLDLLDPTRPVRNRAYAACLEYHVRAELFDRKVCWLANDHGEAIPHNASALCKSNMHATRVRKEVLSAYCVEPYDFWQENRQFTRRVDIIKLLPPWEPRFRRVK